LFWKQSSARLKQLVWREFSIFIRRRDADWRGILLRDVFDCDYDEIALVISKRADTCRQLLRRARQHLGDARARFEVSPEQLQKLARQFALTCASGDLKGLVTALA